MTDRSRFWSALASIPDLALEGNKTSAERALRDASGSMIAASDPLLLRRRALLEKIADVYDLDVTGTAAASAEPGRYASGVSVVTCSRNRTENLLKALPSWLACDDVSEVVIVDWTSDDSVGAAIDEAGLNDPRVRVVRVEDEPRWILSHAFNIGFQVASFDKILKADADIVIESDFFRRNRLKSGQFIAGNWRKAAEGQAYVNGFFYTWHEDLDKVAGFNEYITTYGWDDDELYARLHEIGLDRIDVTSDSIFHLPHDDAARNDQGAKAKTAPAAQALPKQTTFLIRRNRHLANMMPTWNEDRQPVLYDVLQDDDSRPVMKRRSGSGEQPPSAIEREAFLAAARELLAWRYGNLCYGVPLDRIECLVETRTWDDIALEDLIVALQARPDQLTADANWLFVDARQTEGSTDLALVARITASAKGQSLTPVWLGGVAPEGDDLVSLPGDLPFPGGKSITVEDLEKGIKPGSKPLVLTLPGSGAVKVAAPSVSTARARIYADGQHGLGNRLRAVASAAAIAEATDRELVIVWKPDDHCDCRFTDLFDYHGPIEEDLTPDQITGDVFNYMEIEDGSEKDKPVILADGRDAYLRSAYVLQHPASTWETENAFLKHLRPAEAVCDLIDGVRWPNDVSAHIRMAGGKEFEHLPWESAENWTQEGHEAIAHWREKSHYSNFIKRIDDLMEKGEVKTLFVAADLPETYAFFVEKYGDRLSYLERDVNDRSAEQLRYALADAILLGHSPRLLGSNWSSFTELAMRMATNPIQSELSGRDF